MRLDTETIINPTALPDIAVDQAETLADFHQILKDGITAAQSGDRTSARRLLFQASGIDPQCENVWMWLASISEYPEELLIFLGHALEIDPENTRAIQWRASTRSLLARTFVQRAAAAHQEGSLEKTEQCVEQALAYDADCSLAWLWKASLEQDEGQKVEFLEKVLQIEPENADAQTALNAILSERSRSAFNEVKSAATAGRRKKALELVNEFLRSEPNIADAWILRSHLAIGLDDKIESLERALEIDPENATARSAYDFLRSTVGGASEQHPKVGEEATQENSSVELQSTLLESEADVPFQDDASDTVLIEKPLESVFDLETVPYDQETVPAEPHKEPASEEAVQVSGVSEIYEPIIAAPAYEPGLSDDSSDQFENTLLEAFHTPILDVADKEPFELEEISHSKDGGQDFLTPEQPHFQLGSIDPECVPAPDEPLELSVEPNREEVIVRNAGQSEDCPYCGQPNEYQAFTCISCRASLSLSDIEGLLYNSAVDREAVQSAVTQMEAEWNLRDLSELELTQLGTGYLNLGQFETGMKYIQEASRLNPNNVILAGQLNALAIRLDEMRRQDEAHELMPKGKTILVVDDSATVRKLISSKLEKSGHYVVCAEDGVEALARLEEQIPDLVLLDISMPRMDGYDVCKQIRANPAARDLPVVMISGKDGFFDKVRGRMAGSTGYVTKPFGPETLMKALETYLLPEPVLAD